MTHSTEINTTLAMLVSVFGNPTVADSDAKLYEWKLEFADGSKADLNNSRNAGSTGRILTWEVNSDSESGIPQVLARLEEGENYYDGTLHPELFINRHS